MKDRDISSFGTTQHSLRNAEQILFLCCKNKLVPHIMERMWDLPAISRSKFQGVLAELGLRLMAVAFHSASHTGHCTLNYNSDLYRPVSTHQYLIESILPVWTWQLWQIYVYQQKWLSTKKSLTTALHAARHPIAMASTAKTPDPMPCALTEVLRPESRTHNCHMQKTLFPGPVHAHREYMLGP